MNSESALTFVSSLLTYVFKSTAAYLLLCLLVRSIRNPHVRFRLYGFFLGGAVATWLYLLLSHGLRVLPGTRGTADGILSARHLSLALNPVFLPGFAKGFSLASWGYGISFVLLLARFCGHSWQLRNFLRASQPPRDAVPTENVIACEWPKNQQHLGPARTARFVMKTPHVTLLHEAWGNL